MFHIVKKNLNLSLLGALKPEVSALTRCTFEFMEMMPSHFQKTKVATCFSSHVTGVTVES